MWDFLFISFYFSHTCANAGVCESDSDSDGEVAWAKARKQSEYLEGVEKQALKFACVTRTSLQILTRQKALQETYKQRRSAEQAALNQRFFETRHKKEEPILGVDINAPLLHESMFACAEELSVLERCKPRPRIQILIN